MVFHCSAGSIPTRSIRQPCGMKTPNFIVMASTYDAIDKSRREGTFDPCAVTHQQK